MLTSLAFFVGGNDLSHNPRPNAAELRASLRNGNAIFQAADNLQPKVVTAGYWEREIGYTNAERGDRYGDFGRCTRVEAYESFLGNADYRKWLPFDKNLLAQHSRIAAEATPPESIADHRDA